MIKKSLPVLLLSLLLAGCASQLTNLTPQQQHRNANNLYPVEVSFNTRQETVRWQSIRPQIVVGPEVYPMRPTLLMTNRWEGLVPVPQGTSQVHYRYKFDFKYNAMGKRPQPDSTTSPDCASPAARIRSSAIGIDADEVLPEVTMSLPTRSSGRAPAAMPVAGLPAQVELILSAIETGRYSAGNRRLARA